MLSCVRLHAALLSGGFVVALGACGGGQPSHVRVTVPISVQYERSESAIQNGAVTLYIRFSDTSLSSELHDLRCELIAISAREFDCPVRLTVPTNDGTTDHKVWVVDSTRLSGGPIQSSVVASSIYINRTKVRVFPSPIHEVGFFQITHEGTVR